VDHKLLTLLICKDDLAHPRADEQTDRTLANVTDDLAFLRLLYPFHKVEVVSFETMMYLVDFDDTAGYKFTLVSKAIEEVVATTPTMDGMMDVVMTEPVTNPSDATGTMGADDLTKPVLNDGEIATLSQQIIDDDRAHHDALLHGGDLLPQKQMMTGALAKAGGIRDRNERADP
jgi:hypothetical protein